MCATKGVLPLRWTGTLRAARTLPSPSPAIAGGPRGSEGVARKAGQRTGPPDSATAAGRSGRPVRRVSTRRGGRPVTGHCAHCVEISTLISKAAGWRQWSLQGR